jgi:hypothetical protein
MAHLEFGRTGWPNRIRCSQPKALFPSNVHDVHDRHPLLFLRTARRLQAPDLLLGTLNPSCRLGLPYLRLLSTPKPAQVKRDLDALWEATGWSLFSGLPVSV